MKKTHEDNRDAEVFGGRLRDLGWQYVEEGLEMPFTSHMAQLHSLRCWLLKNK
jgi:hypothetical protein